MPRVLGREDRMSQKTSAQQHCRKEKEHPVGNRFGLIHVGLLIRPRSVTWSDCRMRREADDHIGGITYIAATTLSDLGSLLRIRPGPAPPAHQLAAPLRPAN